MPLNVLVRIVTVRGKAFVLGAGALKKLPKKNKFYRRIIKVGFAVRRRAPPLGEPIAQDDARELKIARDMAVWMKKLIKKAVSFVSAPCENFRQATESEGEAFRMSEPKGWRACSQRS